MKNWRMFKLSKKIVLRGLIVMVLMAGASLRSGAQTGKEISTGAILTAKNFPLLYEIARDKRIIEILKGDRLLAGMQANNTVRIKKAIGQCGTVLCLADIVQFTPKEIAFFGDEIIRIQKDTHAFSAIIGRLKKRGVYALSANLPDTAFLRNAWRGAAGSINRIFDVYLRGKSPRYPRIDSISFASGDTAYLAILKRDLTRISGKSYKRLFYSLPLDIAIITLKINGRDEATRYEPLNEGVNALPVSALAKTHWQLYRYSVILVPGLGPERPGVALDPLGIKRCVAAVLRYHAGLAPFIVVSGGHVHPFRTSFNEAIQMKKYLVDRLHVPAAAVFAEPYARHTTTNLRNTIRMIYNFGLPLNKPVLIVTDEDQSNYIVNKMVNTAMRDLGYEPYRKIKKISEVETEFYPSYDALQVDPLDPLDP